VNGVSIILTTFNQADVLEKSLLGFSLQTDRPDEVVIADDGSSDRTPEVLEWAKTELGLNVQHVWQEDRGFRKCRILNKAILAASQDYLVFTDCDCIPRRDFLSAHLAAREPGVFLSGGYVKLPKAPSAAIAAEDIRSGEFADRAWLIRQGMPRFHKYMKLAKWGSLAPTLNRLSTTKAGWHGHNASVWRSDAVRIRGFDERMGYGGEDLEFGDRLVHAGVEPRRIRYSAVTIHLFHERPYVDPEARRENDQIRAGTRKRQLTETAFGTNLLDDESSSIEGSPA